MITLCEDGPLDQEGQWPCRLCTPRGQLFQIQGRRVQETYSLGSLGGNLSHNHGIRHFLEQTPHVWGSSRQLSTVSQVRSWNALSLASFAASVSTWEKSFWKRTSWGPRSCLDSAFWLMGRNGRKSPGSQSQLWSSLRQNFMVQAVRSLLEPDNLRMAPSQSRISRDSVSYLMFFIKFIFCINRWGTFCGLHLRRQKDANLTHASRAKQNPLRLNIDWAPHLHGEPMDLKHAK